MFHGTVLKTLWENADYVSSGTNKNYVPAKIRPDIRGSIVLKEKLCSGLDWRPCFSITKMPMGFILPLVQVVQSYGFNSSVLKTKSTSNIMIYVHYESNVINMIIVIHICLWFSVIHWDRDKMVIILQTTFSNAFYWMKMFELRLNFHWSLFPRLQITLFHYLNLRWLVYQRIYASLGLNELTHVAHMSVAKLKRNSFH